MPFSRPADGAPNRVRLTGARISLKTLAVSTTLMSALLVASSGPQTAVNETAGVWQQGHAGDVTEEDQAVIEEYSGKLENWEKTIIQNNRIQG